EKEKFPREHIGESQLPGVCYVLHEMGAWDKVEAAGFPIKIGAVLTWGAQNETWDFEFLPVEDYVDEPRPGRYEGQRTRLAFQVDRAIYDNILLRHAEEMGAEVFEETMVQSVEKEGDRITGFVLSDGRRITADWYVDGSGVHSVIRKAMGVGRWEPEQLRNIAIWDYWQNTEWAERIGVGATRIQIRSLPHGWMWFIPLGPTRTSIGLVCPSEHYKRLGKSPEDLYLESVAMQPMISRLTAGATRENLLTSCKDWSHLADRITGENWLLVGEAAGFADPILSAGMNIAHKMGLDAAYTILELRRGIHEADWLLQRYNDSNRTSISQHIAFAQFWYSSNGCLTDLKDHCAMIAREGGLPLSPDAAWSWLARGGFASENPEMSFFGSFNVATAKGVLERLLGERSDYCFNRFNTFRLDTSNSTSGAVGHLKNGAIEKVPCFVRGEASLPRVGFYKRVMDTLARHSDVSEILTYWQKEVLPTIPAPRREFFYSNLLMALEAMVTEGWVKGSRDPSRPVIEGGKAKMIRLSSETHASIQAKADAPTYQKNY
ncbi:MAG: tryptophan 7-halogenase, partial [Phycisphaerales bacterium]|nr:tryptophan 7-halogenase [Phycisphaerales bacterium]